MLTNLALVFICVQASSALVRTSSILQPVVRGQVYIFKILPPLMSDRHLCNQPIVSVSSVCWQYVVSVLSETLFVRVTHLSRSLMSSQMAAS